jgi:hypothetical protein
LVVVLPTLWLAGGHLVAARRHLLAGVEQQQESMFSSEGVRFSTLCNLTIGSRAWLLLEEFAGVW